jgi:hypothetical protein
MDNKTKLYLKNMILESISSNDVDEMAYKQKNVRDDRGKLVKYKPFFKEDNDSEIPDYWIANPKLEEGAEVLVVPLDCQELEEFKNANQQWLDSIGALHNLEPQLASCKRGKYHRPVEKWVEGGYKPTGAKYSESERIKRIFNDIISSELEDEQFAEILNKRSIPSIIARDRSNVSQYGKFTNQQVVYETHNNNAYNSVKDFLMAAIARVKGNDTSEMKTFYMARQYNTQYNNWRADKKNLKKYEGKTPKYGLDAYGLEQDNLDVTIRMDLDIKGEMIGNGSFAWMVNMTTKLGKKIETDSGFKDGFLDDKTISVNKTAQFEPNKEFNDSYTIMDNENIREALIEAINELKSKIESVDPKETIKLANVKRYQINPNNQMNEDKIQRLISKVVKEVRQ